jgi:hypothetical protein
VVVVAALSDVGIAALGALAGALATVGSIELVSEIKRWRRRGARPREAFRVRFIEVSGGNVCDRLEQQTEQLGDLQAFRVALLFELWSDRNATVTHMDISYDWPESMRAELSIVVGPDRRELRVDDHFWLLDPLLLSEGAALRVRIDQRFMSTEYMTHDRDNYREFALACSLASAEGGLELLTISGRLESGGRVADVTVRLEADDQLAREQRRLSTPQAQLTDADMH